MSVLEKMLAKSGRTIGDLPRNTTTGRLVRRKGVPHTREFERIKNMPRRVWETAPTLPELIQLLTQEFKTPGGTMVLKASQAQGLADAHDYHCLFAPLPVGEGKTLLAFLLPAILELSRAVLFVPSKLVEKTVRERDEIYAPNWKIFEDLKIISYEKLQVVSGTGLLEALRPQIIMCDEAHFFKNLRSARTKKMRRYMEEFPETLFIPMSGTMIDNSIWDFEHLQKWALPPELRILPDKWNEVRDYAEALDVKVARRMAPGALLELCEPGERNDLSGVRKAFGRRMVETPGVVSTSGADVKCSLTVEAKIFNGYSDDTESAFADLRRWTTPDGWPIPDAIVRWAHACEFAQEFYFRWNPRPPIEWLVARKEWCAFSREVLSENSALFSELEVVNAVDRGEYPGDLLATWRAVKPLFDPEKNRESVWMGSNVLDMAASWLEDEKGIVWTHHPEVGIKLSDMLGVPYFGRQGRDKDKNTIESCKGGPIIASIKANSEGRNLQDRWHKSLCLFVPGTTKEMEQLIGRLHRPFQTADNVSFEFLVGCTEQYNSLMRAHARSDMASDTGKQKKKMLIADFVCDHLKIAMQSGPRWA